MFPQPASSVNSASPNSAEIDQTSLAQPASIAPESTESTSNRQAKPAALANLPEQAAKRPHADFAASSSNKHRGTPSGETIPATPQEAPKLLSRIKTLLQAGKSEKKIDMDLLSEIWSAARSTEKTDPTKFTSKVRTTYQKREAAARKVGQSADEANFKETMTKTVQAGGYPNWALPSTKGAPAISASNPLQWTHSKTAEDSQLTSTRLADFVLSQHESLRTKGKELQAVASAGQHKVLMSMNNKLANVALQKRYPDATALKNELGKFIAGRLDKAPVAGDSSRLNEDDRLRRATELFQWLETNDGVEIKVAANPQDRHAEIAISLELRDDPDMKAEGRAAGSKPPCTGCALWFNEQGELSEYDDNGAVQVGPLFPTASGMRTQFEQAGVEPKDAVNAADTVKVANTLAMQLSKLKLKLDPVTSGGVENIPRSPTVDDPTTPTYDRAFRFGEQLKDR